MIFKAGVVLLLTFLLLSCSRRSANGSIEIEWKDNLSGDFSFHENWSYPDGVFKNEYGELVCDGLCPEASFKMVDSTGKIYPDSLTKYYNLVDTTHQQYTLQCEAVCYEWAGTDFIEAERVSDSEIRFSTLTNIATHSSLVLTIKDNKCIPQIKLHSISSSEIKTFHLKNGYIKIDKKLWAKNILKAEFDFNFINTHNANLPMFWRGEIYKEF